MKGTLIDTLVWHSVRGRAVVGTVMLLLIVVCCALTLPGPFGTGPEEAQKALVQNAYGRLPLYFIQNQGQLDDTVKYYERGLGHSILFTNSEILFNFEAGADHLNAGTEGEFRRVLKEGTETRQGDAPRRFSQVRLSPVHMHEGAFLEGLEPQEGKVNYFLGNDPTHWRTNIATYRSVVYREAYPGIDLKFYGSNEHLEYDVIVKPGADPSQVKFGYSGIKTLSITESGDLELRLADGGQLIHRKPLVYQEIDGERHAVEGAFAIEPAVGREASAEEESFVFGFKLAAYNKAHPLIIDPVLVYSSYLGGLTSDTGYAIAVDGSGYAYVTGRTYSTSYPTAGSPFDGSFGGVSDAFVTKLNVAGTALVYSTYLGGSDSDWANGIAVDGAGAAYVTGETTSADFPTSNPFMSALSSEGFSDAFVVKLNSNGTALIYSTYLGGNLYDVGLGITVDSSGQAYVTGETSSTDFPIAGAALQSIYGGGYADAFVTILNASGNNAAFSTYLGGHDADSGYGIAVDTGSIHVVGETASENFPTTGGSHQDIYAGGSFDAFVVKIARSDYAVLYATYLGGSGGDYGRGVAVGSDGAAYVTGSTTSPDFPLANPLQATPGGGEDVFVAKLNSAGNELSFSTYLGGTTDDTGFAIAVDGKNNACITGKTSGNFPTSKAVQAVYGGGGSDAFVTRIECTEGQIAYSTYLGGAGVDVGRGIAVGAGGNVYLTGWSSSFNFPTTSGAFMQVNAGAYDVFVTKLQALLADFTATPTTGFYPLTVAFTDTSEGTASSWFWDFGDGGNATTKNPSHTYTAAGSYTVSLTVSGTGGEDTKTRTGYIRVGVPEITISATTPSVPETGGGNGQFTVHRSDYISVPLTVNYTVIGTAVSGTDYTALSGSLTIPSGSSSAVISVVPIWDKVNDGDKTVVVALTSSTLYSIGSPGSATVTIVDHDPPTVTVSASVASVTEKSTQTGLYVFSRAGLTTSPLTIYYAVTGTAVAGTNYIALPGSVTIPAGQTSAPVQVAPIWDQVYVGDKTVVVTISANSLYAIATPSSATVIIKDSDLPTVTIEAAISSISDNGTTPGEYVVTHTGTTALPLTVRYSVSGTAVSGTNFVTLSGSVVIPVGSASAPIILTPIKDGQFTGDLTVVVSITPNSAYLIGSPNAATITIVESDLPTVTVSATQPNSKEATVTGQFTVSRTGTTVSPLTVSYTTGGTAVSGVNYTALAGTVTIPASIASVTITVQPLEEELWQGPTTVVLSLAASSQYTIGSSGSATVTIADNDGPTITIVATRPTVAESDTGKGQYTVTRSAHTDVALTVNYVVSGTATGGVDFVALPGSMTIPAGYSSGSILVTPLEDFVSDGDKTVVVTITDSDWYKIGSPNSATVTILDSDLPMVTIAATVSKVYEKGSENAQFAVTRVGPLTAALVVNYVTGGTAISGVDYTAPAGAVTIPAGSASAAFTVDPLWDKLYDGNQTLVVTLAGSSQYNVGSPGSATAVIVDQDRPTVTITAPVPTALETGPGTGQFLVGYSGTTVVPVTVSYTISGTATSGVDFVALPGTITIPAGSSSAGILVLPIDDGIPDDAESVVVTLQNSPLYIVGSPGSATVTIYEAGSPTVRIEATTPIAMEGGSAGQFTVYRTKMTTEALTVGYSIDGTAVANGHYTALPGSVTLPVGAASASITVQAIENAVYEGPTSVVLTLLPSAHYDLGADTTATVTVADNDGPTIDMETIVSKRVGSETGPVAAQVKVYRSTSNTSGAVPVAYSLGGTATNGEDYENLSGEIIIPDGVSTVFIDIIPIDDNIDEPRETVELSLLQNGWYTIGWHNEATAYIADNDLPAVAITALDDNASEEGTNNGMFRVTRQGVLTSSLLVYYEVGGTATNGSRYARLNGSVTIQPETSYADITVSPFNDASYQGDETVTLTILGTDLYHAGSPSSATITIYDNDLPTVTIAAPVASISENDTDHGVFRVSRNGNPAIAPPLEVNYTVGGTAVSGVHYNASFSESVTIPAGAAFVDLEIVPLNNETQDGTQTVVVTLASGPGYSIGSASSALVSILDDEVPSVSIVATDDLASENATDTGMFRISRTADLSAAMEVTCQVSGTAVPGLDYAALPASVTIPAGEDGVDLIVSAIDDQTAQLDRTVIVTLSSSDSGDYYVGSPDHATVTIVDDDPPIVSITALRNATETGTKGQFQFSRVGNTQEPLKVKIKASGTAVKKVNYKAFSNLISIPAGKASRILNVTPIDDDLSTGDLTLILSLVEDSNYLMDPSNSATILITDNDLPEVTVAATSPYAIETGLTKGGFTITRTRGTDTALTVKYSIGGTAKAGTDYKKLSGTVKFAAGQSSKVIKVVPINNGKVDVARTVELTIKPDTPYFVGTPSKDVVYIVDSGLPEVSIVAEDGIAALPSDTGKFVISRIGPSTAALQVRYTVKGTAKNGTDYTKLTGKATIAKDNSSVNVKVTPLEDGEVVDNEKVVLTLVADDNYTLSAQKKATVTILGTSLPVVEVVAKNPNASESGPTAGTYTITRTGKTTSAATIPFTLSGTATNGKDYQNIVGTVDIPMGASFVDVTIMPKKDALKEGDETAILTIKPTLRYIVGPAGSATVTIEDNN